jgi:hypothetical protein
MLFLFLTSPLSQKIFFDYRTDTSIDSVAPVLSTQDIEKVSPLAPPENENAT